MALDSYVTVDEATAYMDGRLFADPWQQATTQQREAALVMASRAIDRQPLRGRKSDPEQPREFPRAVRTPGGWLAGDAVPVEVVEATCEEALALLDRGNSARRRLQAEGVTSMQLGTLSEVYATGPTARSVKPSGLISQEARELIAHWLARSVPIR